MKDRRLLIPLLVSIALTASGQPSRDEGMKKINGANLYMNIQGKGEPLIVIHGGPGLNHAYFRPFLDPLSKRFRLVYYDQRGCGRSATPQGDSISMKFLVDDIEGIRKYLGVEKINILSHSWGAVQATVYAMRYPDRVDKMVYSNPAPLNREYDEVMSKSLKRNTTRDDSMLRVEILSKGNLGGAEMERLFKISFRATAFDPANVEKLQLGLPENFVVANRALFTRLSKDLAAYDYYDEVKKFDFPVLILHGAADGIPYESITRLHEAIPGSRIRIFEKSGHFPFVEEEKTYQEAVMAFVRD